MLSVKPKRIKHTEASDRKYADAIENVARVFPYPSPEGKARLKFEGVPEGENASRSLTGLYDWDAVEKANKASRKGR